MEKDRGSFQSYEAQSSEHIRRHFQDRMKHYSNWFQHNMSAAPSGMSRRMTEHVSDAFTLLHKVSEVRDLHDVVRVHTEFVQKKINMLNEHAKKFTEMTTTASHVVGAFASLLQLRKLSEDIARNSPKYKATDGEGLKPHWRAGP